jgi:alkylhydroperoxidase/carboxymuconolactone decarboxylase family protein YurZ
MVANFDEAMAVRRAVLGDDYVTAAVAKATPFTAPFQQFVTQWAWGEAWLDDRLDPRTRSLLTLATVTVLGQVNEIRLHTAGALRNGCSPDEIAAVFQHVAVYAGVALAVAGVNVANEVISAWTPADEPRSAGSPSTAGGA